MIKNLNFFENQTMGYIEDCLNKKDNLNCNHTFGAFYFNPFNLVIVLIGFISLWIKISKQMRGKKNGNYNPNKQKVL